MCLSAYLKTVVQNCFVFYWTTVQIPDLHVLWIKICFYIKMIVFSGFCFVAINV